MSQHRHERVCGFCDQVVSRCVCSDRQLELLAPEQHGVRVGQPLDPDSVEDLAEGPYFWNW